MKTLRVKQPADRLGKHSATIWRAIRCGAIDIDDENSIQQYLLGNKRRQNPNTIGQPNADVTETNISPPEPDRTGPVGRRGAAAALQCLEEIEERAHACLMRAIEIGNPFQVKAAQEFYLRRVRLCAGSIWRLKPNAGTQRNRCQKSRLRLSRSMSRNGSD